MWQLWGFCTDAVFGIKCKGRGYKKRTTQPFGQVVLSSISIGKID